MSDTKTTIVVSEDGMFANEPVQIEKMVNIFCAATTGAINQIKEQLDAAVADENNEFTEKDKEVALKNLFDGLNGAYSRQLEICFPELELHPELTEEVMKKVLKAEETVAKHRAEAKKKKTTK